MPGIPFSNIPDNARAWVFAASRPVLGEEAERLLRVAEAFVRGWLAHGQPVVGAVDWRHDHFLIVAADEEATGVSGCSIDSLFRTLREAERELGVSLLDSSFVWYRNYSGQIEALPRPEFRERVSSGEVTDDTTVFDNTVGKVGQIRQGEWERPFRESWHGRAFAARRTS